MVIRRRLMMMMMVQGSQEVANGDFCIVYTDAWHACVAHITDDGDGDDALLYRVTVALHH